MIPNNTAAIATTMIMMNAGRRISEENRKRRQKNSNNRVDQLLLKIKAHKNDVGRCVANTKLRTKVEFDAVDDVFYKKEESKLFDLFAAFVGGFIFWAIVALISMMLWSFDLIEDPHLKWITFVSIIIGIIIGFYQPKTREVADIEIERISDKEVFLLITIYDDSGYRNFSELELYHLIENLEKLNPHEKEVRRSMK